MVTLTAISPRQTTDYYQKDDYYARTINNEDFWMGSALTQEDAAHITTPVINGTAPLKMEDYLKTVASIRGDMPYDSTKLALDLTFSPPKSISLAALDPDFQQDLIQAHNIAMEKVLHRVETECMIWREHKGKKTSYINTHHMLAACIQHRISRELDPQLHTHVIIFRKIKTPNGYGTMEDKFLYNRRYLYSLLYDNELANQLMKRGYNLETVKKNPRARYGSFELKGVSPELIQFYSKREQQLKNYQSKNEIADSWLGSHYAAKASRQAKPEINLPLLEDAWRKEIQEKGGMQVSRDPLKRRTRSLDKLDSLFTEAIHDLEVKNFSFTKEDLQVAFFEKTIPLGATGEDFNLLYKNNLYRLFQPMGHLSHNLTENFTTKNNLEKAKEIDHILLDQMDFSYNSYTQEEAKKAISKENQKLKDNAGWELTKGQKDAIYSILTSREKYIAIEGIAGAGKTTALKYVSDLLEAKDVTVKGMAFTGKAAESMETEAQVDSTTIHKFFTALTNQPQKNLNDPHWDFSRVKKAEKPEVWIVDESSMLNDRLTAAILEAAEQKKSKVVFLGDTNQLQPIGTGNAFQRMVRENKLPVTFMKEITRQEKNSELRKAVEALSGKFPKGEKHPLEKYLNDKITESHLRKSLFNSIVRDYCSYSKDEQKKAIILVAQNKDKDDLNNKVRKRLLSQDKLQPGTTVQVINHYGDKVEKEFSIGDKIIFEQNNYKSRDFQGKNCPVKNGQLGQVVEASAQGIMVESNGHLFPIARDSAVHMDYAYALTSHKAQGITMDYALIYHDAGQKRLNSRNKFYVDVSRAKKDVKIYTNDKEALIRQTKTFQKKYSYDDFTKGKKKEPPKLVSEKGKEKEGGMNRGRGKKRYERKERSL